MTSSGCSMEGPFRIGNGANRTGGSAILKFIWGGILLYFPGFGDLQPYETWKFRICSESVSGVFPDFAPEMLNRTRGTAKTFMTRRHGRPRPLGVSRKLQSEEIRAELSIILPGYGSCTGRFEQFWCSVRTVPVGEGLSVFPCIVNRGYGSDSGFSS